jgi:hypothetical protein
MLTRSLFILVLILTFTGAVRADEDLPLSRTRVHHLGLRLDTDGAHWAPGLGYMHSHEYAWVGRGGRSWMGWIGYGVDGIVVLPVESSIDAAMGLAVLRSGVFHRVAGLGIEVAAGAGGDHFGARGVAEFGAFVSLYYLDLGYSMQLPLGPFDRPLWMPLHRIGIRLRIPLARVD